MPAPPDTDPRWQFELAGGALMDLGCYALHLHRFLGDEPRVVAARGGERAGHPGVDEWLEATLEHADGVTGIAHCDMAASGWQITAYVVGERGQALAHNFVLPQRDDRLTVWVGDDVRTNASAPARPTPTNSKRSARTCAAKRRSRWTSTTPSRPRNSSTPPTPPPASAATLLRSRDGVTPLRRCDVRRNLR